jgi:hypothetical protein
LGCSPEGNDRGVVLMGVDTTIVNDMAGYKLHVGDAVVHVSKGSTAVHVQLGIVTDLWPSADEYPYWTRPPKVKIRRVWASHSRPLDEITPWLQARNVLRLGRLVPK